MTRGASQCSTLMGRTKSHRTRRNSTGWHCTTHLHSSRRNCSTTCSNLVQVLVWEGLSLGLAAVLEWAEEVEVLESVLPLSALEWGRLATLRHQCNRRTARHLGPLYHSHMGSRRNIHGNHRSATLHDPTGPSSSNNPSSGPHCFQSTNATAISTNRSSSRLG